MQRVLIVDDERLVADTLSLIFARHGFEVRVAYSGESALACARTFLPHLLVSDISMPGKDGLELIADLRSELPDCRVLVLTGRYSELANIQEHARNAPFPAGVMTKPCNPVDLLREAGTMLAHA